MRISRKRMVLIAIVGLFLTILVVLLTNMDGRVTVKITGDIDPTATAVLIDDVLLEPQGKAGAEYSVKVPPGSYTLKITSPYIETISEKVSVAPFSNAKIEKSVNTKTPGQIVTTLVGQEGATVSGAKLYETSWVVAILSGSKTPNKDGATTYPVFYHYEKSTGEWVEVTPETVALIERAPREARSYYESLSED